MCCWFSVSYAFWAKPLSISEHEHIWHANRGNLPTSKLLFLFPTDLITPSPIFKISFSLLTRDRLQHLKILFLIQLSLSHWWCSAQHLFLSWHLGCRVPETRAGAWVPASYSPWVPPPPRNLQPKACAPSGREEGLFPPSWSKHWALAQHCERWVCESSIWYTN